MKKSVFIAVSLLPLFANAQEQHNLNLQSALWSVIPFYFITLTSLLLFVWKLIRPHFRTRWIYLCSLLGIAGAAAATFQFKDIQDSQLPAVNSQIYEMPEMPEDRPVTEEELDDYSQYLYEKRQKEVKMQQFANFWVMAIPNFIVLAFAFYWDWKARKSGEKPGEKRRRYA